MEWIIINKKKVLIVITKADWAGAQRVVYEIAKYVKDNSREIEVDVAVGDNGLLVDRLRELGINTIVLKSLIHNLSLKYDIKGYQELVNLVKKNKYDVVHAHSTKAGILARLAASKCKVNNVIFTVHGWWPILQYEGIKRQAAALVERYMATKTNSLVFICERDIEIAKRFNIGKELQNKKVYNSITIGEVKSKVIRREFGIPDNSKIVGNVARVDKQKNPFRFLDIAEEHIKTTKDDVFYFWVGDGPLIEEVNNEIKQRNLNDRVKFIGFRENGLDYINDFDVLLMTSEAEGMPITVLEAIALKKSIISTDVGGIKEVVGEENIYQKNDRRDHVVNIIDHAKYKCCCDIGNMQKKYIELYLS
ncbi:glycosyltransferase [Clostridium sp.]|uniref:glycosyltransferase n=1 Tax=Clostridium sp. TaxID=1506 RepID=UPI0032169A60